MVMQFMISSRFSFLPSASYIEVDSLFGGGRIFFFWLKGRASSKLIAPVEPLLHSASSITFFVNGISTSVQIFFPIVFEAGPAPHCPIRSHLHTAFSTYRFSFNNWSRRYWWGAILIAVSRVCIIVRIIARSKLPAARLILVLWLELEFERSHRDICECAGPTWFALTYPHTNITGPSFTGFTTRIARKICVRCRAAVTDMAGSKIGGYRCWVRGRDCWGTELPETEFGCGWNTATLCGDVADCWGGREKRRYVLILVERKKLIDRKSRGTRGEKRGGKHPRGWRIWLWREGAVELKIRLERAERERGKGLSTFVNQAFPVSFSAFYRV